METAPLKSFATWARTALIREVNARIAAVLAPGSSERVEQSRAVAALEKAVVAGGGSDKGQAAVADTVAYTWFNRIVSLRFMDANSYTGVGVVSPQAGVEVGQPEILAEAKRGVIDTEVVGQTTLTTVAGLLDGTRSSGDSQGEAYALLLAEYCRHWNRSMPFMFEREGDYTELLIPANLLADDSVLNRCVTVLTEDVCKDVEVIGWLYQFYILERKDEVFAGFKQNKKASADEIPAATQLFTPHWIVRYLVDNSLGRLWMLNRPSSGLVGQMDYYIAPVDEETDFLRITTPEELTVIDPACGSGHMLTYAFDLLYAIYEEEGYAPSEIPGLILANNLYGTEIDLRAGALAAFALTMKARSRQRTFFNRAVEPHVCVIEPISLGHDALDFLLTRKSDRHEVEFWNQFAEADTFGSLIQPDPDLTLRLTRHLDTVDDGGDMFKASVIERAHRVLAQATYLEPRYSVVVANPPYMGSGSMGSHLADWIRHQYPDEKQDLYACFVSRASRLVGAGGMISMVIGDTWMTIKSFEKFRADLLSEHSVVSFLHLHDVSNHPDVFGANTAFVLSKSKPVGRATTFFRLDQLSGTAKRERFLEALRDSDDRDRYLSVADTFRAVPGSPILYWADGRDLELLASGPCVFDYVETREGLTTGDNSTFLRRWHEVGATRIAWDSETRLSGNPRWFLYIKGGEVRRWYGNLEYVVDWEDGGRRLLANVDMKTGRVRSHNYNGEYAFREGFTWSGLSSSHFSARYVPDVFMFDATGPMGFARESRHLLAIIGYLNSSASGRFLRMLSPTLHFKIGHILSLPVRLNAAEMETLRIEVEAFVDLGRRLWDNEETSFGFESLEIVDHDSVGSWTSARWGHRIQIVNELGVIQRRIDKLVDSSLGIESAKRTNESQELVGDGSGGVKAEIEALVSYAIGCMFGRYSLDKPGLILADQGAPLQDYLAKVPSPTFTPDADNVIPIVVGDWFEDDILERFRQFLQVAFGEQHFEENLRFVTESLGVKNLGDYFVKSFYKDHVQRYKKRPIYWLFSSPKGSFNALIYMHRYTPSTVSTVLNEYLREFQAKLKASLEHAERSNNAREADRLRTVLLELDEYEHDVLYPLASQNVIIHLDDGVKANYPKFGDALKKIPGLEASE